MTRTLLTGTRSASAVTAGAAGGPRWQSYSGATNLSGRAQAAALESWAPGSSGHWQHHDRGTQAGIINDDSDVRVTDHDDDDTQDPTRRSCRHRKTPGARAKWHSRGPLTCPSRPLLRTGSWEEQRLGARRWRASGQTPTRSLGLGSGEPLGRKPPGLALAFWRCRIATAAPQFAPRSI